LISPPAPRSSWCPLKIRAVRTAIEPFDPVEHDRVERAEHDVPGVVLADDLHRPLLDPARGEARAPSARPSGCPGPDGQKKSSKVRTRPRAGQGRTWGRGRARASGRASLVPDASGVGREPVHAEVVEDHDSPSGGQLAVHVHAVTPACRARSAA
jgi:hypothetical protein